MRTAAGLTLVLSLSMGMACNSPRGDLPAAPAPANADAGPSPASLDAREASAAHGGGGITGSSGAGSGPPSGSGGASGAPTGGSGGQMAPSTDASATFRLTIEISGDGRVDSSADGVSCGGACVTTLPAGKAVTLSAIAAPQVRFAGWQGACTGTGPCTVDMTADKYVKAAFPAPVLWRQLLERGAAVAVAGDDIYATGSFEFSEQLAGRMVKSAGDKDMFLARFSADGTLQVLRTFGGPAAEEGTALVVTAAGEVILSGRADSSRVDLGNGKVANLDAAGGSFLVRFSRDLVATAVTPRAGSRALVLDSAGNLLVPDLPGENGRLVLALLDPNGQRLWADSTSDYWVDSLIATGDGDFVAVGTFTAAVTVAGRPHQPSGSWSSLLVKYRRGGAVAWSQATAGTAKQTCAHLSATLDASGDFFLGCSFTGELRFGGQSFSSKGEGDFLLARIAGNDGRVLWARPIATPTEDSSGAITTDADGTVLVDLYTRGEIDLGTGARTPGAYLVRVTAAGAFVSVGINAPDSVTAFARHPSGDLVTLGGSLTRRRLGR